MNPAEISNLVTNRFSASEGPITIKRGIPTVYNRDDIFCQVLANRRISQPAGCNQLIQGQLSLVATQHCYVAIDTYKVAPQVPAAKFINTKVTMVVNQKFDSQGHKVELNPPKAVDCLIVDVRHAAHSRSDRRMIIDMNPGNQIGGGPCQHLGMCWIPGVGYQTQDAFKSYLDSSRAFQPDGVGQLDIEFTYDLQQLY